MELSKLNNNINFYKIHLREFQIRLDQKKKEKKKFRLDRHFLAHLWQIIRGWDDDGCVQTSQMLPCP